LQQLLLVLFSFLCVPVVYKRLSAVTNKGEEEESRQSNQNDAEDPSPEEVLAIRGELRFHIEGYEDVFGAIIRDRHWNPILIKNCLGIVRVVDNKEVFFGPGSRRKKLIIGQI
jgi:hypothetical protein